jgi:hypothetical protein
MLHIQTTSMGSLKEVRTRKNIEVRPAHLMGGRQAVSRVVWHVRNVGTHRAND